MTSSSTLSHFINEYRELKKGKSTAATKVAVLSSFTTRAFEEVITVTAHHAGIPVDVYVADYNQYSQEILDDKSGLYKHQPEMIFLCVDTRSLFGDEYFMPYQQTDAQRKKHIRAKNRELSTLVSVLTTKTKAKVVLHNFEVPTYSPLGLVESKQRFGFIESVKKLNQLLADEYKENHQVFVFDFDNWLSAVGKQKVFDSRMYYVGDIKISFEVLPLLAEAYLGYLKALVGKTKKCVVLDLDNTLWGGVIGEDGLTGIALGPTPQGRPFWEFQKQLLALFNRGIILAINSKNNLDDVMEVFNKHPYMVLKEKHFAAMYVNWNDKASNMKALAKELEIGTDSLVYFDDDPINRALVREKLPEVTVVELPPDPALYVPTLTALNEFNTFYLTEEDFKKGQMYAQQRQRNARAAVVTNLDDFLKELTIIVTLEPANEFNTPRIAQLTQKTNQFNMTTRRYQQEDIEAFAKNPNYLVTAIKVEDKYGDSGLTGVAIVKKGSNEWVIDTFLLSCRVIGRKVEETLLGYIISQARKAGAKQVIGEFITTAKNEPAKGLYQRCHFSSQDETATPQRWVFSTKEEFVTPEFITVIDQTGF